LVKLSPDLTWDAIEEALAVCKATGVRGIIATNTTLSREHLTTPCAEGGGLSGRPLAEHALEVVRFICERLGGSLPVIGVGGILEPDDALRMFAAGAALIQIYTGFIYGGPGIVKRINRALATTG
ncbi:MAG TPA: dihydroorotate dehydrogenase (quinone), partial [Ktedonobacterales bacterium]|nr:dihydroorotate dehydrogenase (quinone) [Ktedonobacterales bacterium]